MRGVQERFDFDGKKMRYTLLSFAVMIVFWFLPAPSLMTVVGMRTVGVFIGTVMLLSLVDTAWPAVICIPLFYFSGVMPIGGAIASGFGSTTTMFVIMSFIMTYALNTSGFTARIVAWFMSRDFVQKSPWVFTYSLITIGFIVGLFLDQVPTCAFFMILANKVYEELGYKPGDKYPVMVNFALAFAINIAGGMTPISHSLALLGIGIYESSMGVTLNLFRYMMFAVPVGLIIYILMLVFIRLTFKCDMSKCTGFDITKVTGKITPMNLREKTVVVVFFSMVTLWLLPGLLTLFVPTWSLTVLLNKINAVIWALLAVIILAVLEINKEPVIPIRDGIKVGVDWNVVFLVAAAILLGNAVTNDAVGLNALISTYLTPITDVLPTTLMVLVICTATSLMTNFTSNVTTITLMTGVALSVAKATGALNPLAIALCTTMVGALAYMVPASFASIGVLYGNPYSHGGTIFKYGAVNVVFTSLIATFIGYPLACMV